MKQKIKCRRCDGKGEVELDALLAGTLHILKELKLATAYDFWHDHDTENISITAFNKRLERLRHAGLVKREKRGKAWAYRPI